MTPAISAEAATGLAKAMDTWGDPIVDTWVAFLGMFGGHNGGEAGGQDDATADYKRIFNNSPLYAPKRKLVGKTWWGAMNSSDVVQSALAFILQNFDPRGRLIITAASRGGLNALDLCRALHRDRRLFRVRTDQPSASSKGQFVSDNDGSGLTLLVRVDLLFLLDATLDLLPVPRFPAQRMLPDICDSLGEIFQDVDLDTEGVWHGKVSRTSFTSELISMNMNSLFPASMNPDSPKKADLDWFHGQVVSGGVPAMIKEVQRELTRPVEMVPRRPPGTPGMEMERVRVR